MIVLTSDSHATGSGLRLLDLDGRFLRTIAAKRFRNPRAVTASHGKAFVVDDDGDDDDDDDDDDESGNMLHVIDIQSGSTLQRVRFKLKGAASAILVDGDEIYIAGFYTNEIVVLQLAGSEA